MPNITHHLPTAATAPPAFARRQTDPDTPPTQRPPRRTPWADACAIRDTCATWATRQDLRPYTDREVSTAYAAVRRSPQAQVGVPFGEGSASPARTAHLKLLQELQRRGLPVL